MGPDRYGILNYCIAFTTLFGVVGGLGLRNIVVRELVKTPKIRDKVLGTSFLMMLVAGFFAMLLTLAMVYWSRSSDTETLLLVTIISIGFIFKAFQSITYYFEAIVKSKYFVYASNTAYLVASLLKIVCILTNQGLEAFCIIILLETILTSILLIIVYTHYGKRILNWKFDRRIARGLIKDSLPLLLSGIMAIIYMKIDQIMLREMTTDKELGLYSAAVKLTEVWFFIPMIIKSSVFPNLVKTFETDKLSFYNKFYRLFRLMIIFSLAIAILFSLSGNYLVELLFGEDYSNSGKMLKGLIWVLIFVSLGVARSAYLISYNWNNIYFYTLALGAISNILINVVMIPNYGGLGAVVATLISYAIAGYISCFFFKKTRKIGLIMTLALFNPFKELKYINNILGVKK